MVGNFARIQSPLNFSNYYSNLQFEYRPEFEMLQILILKYLVCFQIRASSELLELLLLWNVLLFFQILKFYKNFKKLAVSRTSNFLELPINLHYFSTNYIFYNFLLNIYFKKFRFKREQYLQTTEAEETI
jgi:hypothetical protein